MPIYEYSCPVCGTIEIIQKVDDAILQKCPECEKTGKDSSVERVVSAAAFHLKGSGWYKTDYASSGSSLSANSEKKKPAKNKGDSSENNTTKEKSDSPTKSPESSSSSGGAAD